MEPSPTQWKPRGATVCMIVALMSACGVETVVNGIDEKQANNIVVLMADNSISAAKARFDTGREVTYNIAVPTKNKVEALRILKLHDYPKRLIKGYGEVFVNSGLIPTAAEEKAKELSAIEGEIEKQLRLVNGVLDVEVNIVLPEETALRTTEEAQAPTTASVTVKYLPGKGGAKPLSEPQIQAVVAAGVEGLTPDHVVVVMTPAARGAMSAEANCPEVTGGARGVLSRLPAKIQNAVLAGTLIFVLILCLGLVFFNIRLRTVRSRLLRLQNEIARARRKAEVPASTQ